MQQSVDEIFNNRIESPATAGLFSFFKIRFFEVFVGDVNKNEFHIFNYSSHRD